MKARLLIPLLVNFGSLTALGACGGPTTPNNGFTLSGIVTDIAARPIADARVEVMDGPQAGVFVTTSATGQYALPPRFSAATTIRVSKEGYITATQRYEAQL